MPKYSHQITEGTRYSFKFSKGFKLDVADPKFNFLISSSK